MEEALVLTKYASEVTVIHRREEFRASKAMQAKVLGTSNVKVFWNTEVVEIIGDTKLEKLILKNNFKKNKTTIILCSHYPFELNSIDRKITLSNISEKI